MGKNPAWSWYIVWYFFVGGVAAGAYFLAALADLFGRERAQPVARIGYAIALPLALVCPILLTLDLGMPVRAFYMFRLFKTGSPMSVGSWALLGFGLFSLVSLILVLAETRAAPDRAPGIRRLRRAVGVPGMLLGFFIASYTGVLLGTTNRPVWGGNAWIGPLFIASAASTGAAAIALWAGRARIAGLRRLDVIAIGFEALLLVLFLQSLGAAAAVFLTGSFAPLFWGAVVVAGVALPFLLQLFARGGRGQELVTAALLLVGGFALRYLILLSGQA
ncbi:MAG: polysulfide reductase NrfD [Candidatus Rokubacteria bacterium]|nr:polysulfide reductase NrfD [Candidatus Rokubacteria bacterium]MBI2554295.1 polysulfide reductase NrfD [Candidatus Rokubacteria bacterium]